MKKKIANAIQLVLMVIVFVLLKLPSVEAYHVTASNPTVGHISVFSLIEAGMTFTTWILYILFAIIVLMCVVSIIAKSEHKDAKIHSTLPIFWFIVLAYGIMVSTTNADGSAWVIVSSKGFNGTLVLGLGFAVDVLGFLKRSTLITGLQKEKLVIKQVSDADELAKYKELLDKGVITQDEFEAKKKQLLGL